MTIHAHKLVAETAKEMARALYHEVMRDNDMYLQWREQNPTLNSKRLELKFVLEAYPGLLEEARATLARMLTGDATEHIKMTIHEALCQDNVLKIGRKKPEVTRLQIPN